MTNINDLFDLTLTWKEVDGSLRYWYCDEYPYHICKLRMNNFPEEPLWTLFFDTEALDFDDEPQSWNIIYD